MRGFRVTLNLKRSPPVSFQNNQIRKALQISRIGFKDHRIWHLFVNPLDQFALKYPFEHLSGTSKSKKKEKVCFQLEPPS